MNDDSDMQPMVKGNNLVACLKEMSKQINKLRDSLLTVLDYQRNLTQGLITHTHFSPFFGSPTSPDFTTLMPKGIEVLVNTALNVEIPMMIEDTMDSTGFVTKYLSSPGGMRSSRYILSKYNNTN